MPEFISGAKLCVFCGWSGFRGRRSRVFVSGVPGLDLQKLWTNSAQDCSETSICIRKCWKLSCSEHFWKIGRMCTGTWFQIKILKKADMFGTLFGRRGWQNVHQTVARAQFHIKSVKKNWRVRSAFGRWGRAKFAWDCSKSSFSHNNDKKCHVWSSFGFVWSSSHGKMRRRL